MTDDTMNKTETGLEKVREDSQNAFIEYFAREIHESKNLVLGWDEFPDHMKDQRRMQARYLMDRFLVIAQVQKYD